MSRKESILDAIQRLPDDVDFGAAFEEIRICSGSRRLKRRPTKEESGIMRRFGN
jgi:hypothetical protein